MDRINDLFPDTEEGIAARDFCMEIIVSLLIYLHYVLYLSFLITFVLIL